MTSQEVSARKFEIETEADLSGKAKG